MSTPTDEMLQRLRRICFDYAGTEEKLSHGAPFFHVKGKGFVTFANDHHGDGRVAAWCKSTPDEQQRLVRADPDVYFVPPYVGVKGWVGVRLERPGTDFEALAILVEEAWRSVVPKRLASAAPGPVPEAPVYPTTEPSAVQLAGAQLELICEALPGVTQEVRGGMWTCRVGARPFAYLLNNVHRDGILSVCVRVDRDEAAALATRSPRRYYLPPYIGARGWLAIRVDGAKPPWKEIARRVAESYEAVAPKRRASSAAGSSRAKAT